MKPLYIFLCLACNMTSNGQVAFNTGAARFAQVYDLSGKPIPARNPNEIKGSPLLSENWGTGSVKLNNGRSIHKVLLQLNLYNNQLYYKLDGIEFAFIDPVREFSFSYEDNGRNHSVFFRGGYPGTGPGGEPLFYEVLAEGSRFHLLKRSYKTIEHFSDYAQSMDKMYKLGTDFYIYDSKDHTLTNIKNRMALLKLMPDQAEMLMKFFGNNKNNRYYSEKELSDLIAKLNL